MVNLSGIFVVTSPLFGCELPSVACTKLKNIISICYCLETFKMWKIAKAFLFLHIVIKNTFYLRSAIFSLATIFSTAVFNSTFKYFFGLWRMFGSWNIQMLNISINWVTYIYVDILLFPLFSASARFFINFSMEVDKKYHGKKYIIMISFFDKTGITLA